MILIGGAAGLQAACGCSAAISRQQEQCMMMDGALHRNVGGHLLADYVDWGQLQVVKQLVNVQLRVSKQQQPQQQYNLRSTVGNYGVQGSKIKM
jgi:hypothetical protein